MKILYAFLFCLISCASSLMAQEFYNIELLSNTNYAINGEEGNDIWGFVDANGIEYAVAGSTQATYIYSLEDPANPIERLRIPGATSTWRDIKDHNEYLYVVADRGTDGLLVINMTNAPTDITFNFYKPQVTVGGATTPLDRCHNIYISDEGYAVVSGCNVYSGTPLFFDLSVNPEEPPFIGASRRIYAHDIFAERNRLYSSDIYTGELTIHDYSDPSNIFAQGSALTSTTFTHNAWPTTDDASVFTTDERSGAYVDAFNVTDPSDLIFIDKFRPDDEFTSGSIPHNTHVLGNFLATSWYRDGIILTDVTRPHNMVEVGRYDTYPSGSGDGFDGNWGAYPYLPSGLLLASDINTGLYVFQPTYEQGAYFEGTVIDSVTRQPIGAVDINFANLPAQTTMSDISGDFATGIYEEGIYPVTFTRTGYETKQVLVRMRRGVLNFQEVELVPLDFDNITVSVVDENGVAIPGAQSILNYNGSFGGNYNFSAIGGQWGYVTNQVSNVEVPIGDTREIEVVLTEGFYDDFIFEFNWNIESTATAGQFERAVPIGTTDNGNTIAIGNDVTFDFGGEAYVTQNGVGQFSDFDVDNGFTRITTPNMDLSGMDDVFLEFYYYFYNGGGSGTPDDELTVSISNGTTTATILRTGVNTPDYTKYTSEPLSTLITLTDNMTISFETSDLASSGHIVEAMIDAFSVTAVVRPVVSFSPTSGCAPLTVTANADGATGSSYEWIFSGASTPAASGDSPQATYTAAGRYDVTLRVEDAVGGIASYVYPNAIEVLPTTSAAFGTEVIDQEVAFFNQSIGANTVLWEFGDGATSTDFYPQHNYATTGNFTVTLTVVGDCGTDVATETVVVTTVGTTDFVAETGISLLSNPVREQITLDNANDAAVQIFVHNGLGQLMLSQNLGAQSRTEISTGELSSGLYYITTSAAKAGAIPLAIVK